MIYVHITHIYIYICINKYNIGTVPHTQIPHILYSVGSWPTSNGTIEIQLIFDGGIYR